MNPWTLERLKPFNLPRINGPLRHDAHQLGNSQCLGLYQGAGIGDINTKLGEEQLGINLRQQIGDGFRLGHFLEVEEQGGSQDCGHRSEGEKSPVDGSDVLGAVEVCLVGREAGEDSAHHGDGGHCGATEGGEVVGSQGTGGVSHGLIDDGGDSSKQWDGQESHGLEGGPPTNPVRD